jgi:hypothetical protein
VPVLAKTIAHQARIFKISFFVRRIVRPRLSPYISMAQSHFMKMASKNYCPLARNF